MSGSCCYNCCVLIFDLVDLHTLVSELKSTWIFSVRKIQKEYAIQ